MFEQVVQKNYNIYIYIYIIYIVYIYYIYCIYILMMMMKMNLQALFCSLRLIESFMIFSAEALGNLSTNQQNAEKCLLLTVGHAEIYP